MTSLAWGQPSNTSAQVKLSQYRPPPCYFERDYAKNVANGWREGTWNHLTPKLLDKRATHAWRFYPKYHPKCAQHPDICEAALSSQWIDLEVDVELKGSEVWRDVRQLATYFILTRNYFRQARINLIFKCITHPQPIFPTAQTPRRIRFIFGKEVLSPKGKLVDGFGDLPDGLAVINDRIMDREQVHANPHFLPGKRIGYELGRVLGLSHTTDPKLLMTRGISKRQRLIINPIQSVIMRTLALSRFGGLVGAKPRW